MSDKNIHLKINISLLASITTGDRTKCYVDRNAGGQVESLDEVTQLG